MSLHDGRPDGPQPAAAGLEIPAGQPATLEFGSEQLSGAAVPPQATVKMSKRQLVAVFFAYFTLYLAWIAPLGYSLAVRIAQIDPANRNTILAIGLSVPSFLAVVIVPLVGVLSDRTRSRLGRRRPWMLAGTVLGVLGAVLLGLGTSVPVVLIGWTVSFAGYSVVAAMIITHLGDRLPEIQRGKVMGGLGALSQIGPVIGVAVAAAASSSPALMFIFPGVLAAVGGLIFIAVMKDDQVTGALPAFNLPRLLRGFWFNPRKHPNLGWVILSRALIFLALSFFGLYTVYLLGERLGLDAAAIGALSATIGLGGVVTAILGAVGSGWLSDKLGYRKPFLVISGLLLGAAMLLVATMTNVGQYAVAALLSSFAIGVYGAVDQATGLDVMPREGENGRYLAIFGLGNQVPQSFGPLLAALVLAIVGGDYGWVYVAAGAFAVLGAIAILPLRLPRRSTQATAETVAA
jgi:MFS family permease